VIKKPRKTRRLKPDTGLWKIQPQWVVTPRKQTAKFITDGVRKQVFCVSLIKIGDTQKKPINLLKPNVHVLHQQINIQEFFFLATLY
jgi:hypothetical protein